MQTTHHAPPLHKDCEIDRMLTKELDGVVKQRIDDCAYRFCFSQVTWSLEDEDLVLKGRVPSFYLKQVLQTLLRDIQSIRRIDNRVEVVSSTGLSSQAFE